MGDNNQATSFGNNPANAPGAVAEKGKGKAIDPQDVSMDEEESSDEESGPEEAPADDEDDNNLEPIDSSNIISGGRRTRGKNIDFQKAAESLDAMSEDDDDDEDYEGNEANDDDDRMRG